MRYYDEIRETTNNYVFNRLRIPYDSPCGWCGCGSSHSNSYKHKYYYVRIKKNGQIKSVYPSWKLVSKNKKQWMEKNLWWKNYKNSPMDYGIKWRGNDLY